MDGEPTMNLYQIVFWFIVIMFVIGTAIGLILEYLYNR